MKKAVRCALALCLLLLSACGTQTATEEPATPTDTAIEVVTPEEPVEETPVEEPTATETLVDVVLYLPNENVDGFDQTTVQLPLEATQIVTALVEAEALPEGSEVLRMIVNGNHMDLDMTQTYGDAVCSTGTTGELMLTGSLVNTFITAYGVTEITVTIEGETMESGHNVYDFPLEFTEG